MVFKQRLSGKEINSDWVNEKHLSTSASFHLNPSNKSILPFSKKHTTFFQKAYYLFQKSMAACHYCKRQLCFQD